MRYALLLIFATLSITGCAGSAELLGAINCRYGGPIECAEDVLDDVGDAAREAGRTAERVGDAARETRDGVRGTVGATARGRVAFYARNAASTSCHLELFARDTYLEAVAPAGRTLRFNIYEDLVEGDAEASLLSDCGGRIRRYDVDQEFRRRGYGGHTEHVVIVLEE